MPAPAEGKNVDSARLEEEREGRKRGETSGDDKREGAMDKKAEGRADQRRGTMKEKKDHLKDLFK